MAPYNEAVAAMHPVAGNGPDHRKAYEGHLDPAWNIGK